MLGYNTSLTHMLRGVLLVVLSLHGTLNGSNDPRLKERMDAVKTHALADLNRKGEQGDT